MRTVTMRFRFLATLALLALLSAGHAAAQNAAGSPSQIVQANATRVLTTLDSKREEYKANPAALRAFIKTEFDQIFDKVYAARLVLGKNGRSAQDSEVRDFADALAESLMLRYGNSLLEVDADVSIKVTGESALKNGAVTRVTTLVNRKAGEPVPVDYLMRQNGGRWQVFDVIVEGVSFVQTFRTQFDQALRTKSLAQVTQDLRAGTLQARAATEGQ